MTMTELIYVFGTHCPYTVKYMCMYSVLYMILHFDMRVRRLETREGKKRSRVFSRSKPEEVFGKGSSFRLLASRERFLYIVS